MEKDRHHLSSLERVYQILLQERPKDGDDVYCQMIGGLLAIIEQGDRSFIQYLDENPEVDMVLTKERSGELGVGESLMSIARAEIDKQIFHGSTVSESC